MYVSNTLNRPSGYAYTIKVTANLDRDLRGIDYLKGRTVGENSKIRENPGKNGTVDWNDSRVPTLLKSQAILLLSQTPNTKIENPGHGQTP